MGGYILVANIKSYSYLCNHERPPQKKRASELIRLDMKEKETVRAREEER